MTSLFSAVHPRITPSKFNWQVAAPASSILATAALPGAQSTTQERKSPQELLEWMQSVFQARVIIRPDLHNEALKKQIASKLNSLGDYYQHRRDEIARIGTVIEQKQEQLDDLPKGLRHFLERRVLRGDLEKLEKAHSRQADSLKVLEFAHARATPRLQELFSKLDRGSFYQQEGISNLLGAIDRELGGLIKYHQLTTKLALEANRELYKKNGFVRAIHQFRDNVIPAALRSSLPIAAGLLTYHQITGGEGASFEVLPQLAGLVAAGSVAAVSSILIGLRQRKPGETLENTVRDTIRFTGKTMVIGAGLQAVVVLQSLLGGAGLASTWQETFLLTALGGMLEATIGYFTDVAELVGKKLDKFYKPNLQQYYQDHPSAKPGSVTSEVLQFKFLIKDLVNTDGRQKVIEFLKSEGVNTAGLTKSMLFDLTVGAVFGLIIARLGSLANQTKGAARSVVVDCANKGLSWGQKLMSRSVRENLTSQVGAAVRPASLASRLSNTIGELVQTVSE